MITIAMTRRAEGMILEAHGHADYDVAGRDIVCAGVSALMFGLAAYLEGFGQWDPSGRRDRTEGCVGLCLKTEHTARDGAAFAAVAAGLRLIADAFPENVRFAEYGEEKSET